MGKIVNVTCMTLDGDVQSMRDWHGESPWAATTQLLGSDALIMGRETYENLVHAWPERGGVDGFADRINSMEKYVVSSTLADPYWYNTTVISDDVVAEIRALKRRRQRVLQYGYDPVTRLLLDNGLLDELLIWLYPMLFGGVRSNDALYDDMERTRFTLNDVKTHSSGVVVLSYTPVAAG